MEAQEVQHNLEDAISERKDDMGKLESRLENKIKGLEKQVTKVSKDVCNSDKRIGGIVKTVNDIQKTLNRIEPFVTKEIEKKKAIEIVRDMFVGKAKNGQFWALVVAAFLGIIVTVINILEKFKIIK
jgi:archaellum component FlaC